MESVSHAVSLAANAASLALEGSKDAVAPLWSQLELITAAALQVVEAFRLLIVEALGQLIRFVLAHPNLTFGAIAVPVVSLALNVGRWLINLSWERGLRDSRSGRLQSAGRKHRLQEMEAYMSFSSGESDMEMEAEVEEQNPGLDSPSLCVQQKQRVASLASFMMGGPGSSALPVECMEFLEAKVEDLDFGPNESVFAQGDRRTSFFVVKEGEVVVELGSRSSDVYRIGPGNAIVGLLYMLASLPAQHLPPGSSSEPSLDCTRHSSSSRAGSSGAKVAALPLESFSEAFERFPKAMQWLVQRLSVRFSTVVFDTLSTYFGLRMEFMTPSTFKALEALELRECAPEEAFRQLFKGCGEKAAKELTHAETLTCEAGDLVFAPQTRAKHLMILLEGEVTVEVQAGGPRPPVSLGDALGELSILTDKPSPVHYRCVSRCKFAALSREVCMRLLEQCPRAFTLTLLHLIVGRTASWLHRVDACLDWLSVEGGSCLFRAGDEMCGFFMVLSGRLVALDVPEKGAKRGTGLKVTDILQRGRLCGELDDCLRRCPYSATLLASRDTELCRVSPTLLQLIAMDFPQAILHFSAYIGSRPSQVEDISSAKYKTTITVVPATENVDITRVCSELTTALSKLGTTMHISPSTHLFFSPLLKGSAKTLDEFRLARLLAEMEERRRWLVYEAEPACGGKVTDWTKRCVRQADHILVAAEFNGQGRGDVPQTLNEQYVHTTAPLYVTRELLLLHNGTIKGKASGLASMDDWFVGSAAHADTLKPGVSGFVRHHLFGAGFGKCQRSTRHYLNCRPWARRWHHVRGEDLRDWARVARLLAGKAVGVCFGGGGARGNVHFGVIQAMQELDIPIDVVSGTSFGALAAAMYAISAPEPTSLRSVVKRVMTTQFSTRKLLWDLTFPRTANFTGAFLNSMLKDIFARRRCEDLLIPFSCTSTDIVQFKEKVHRDGPIWRVVRASMSLVGIAPPLPHQERRENGKVTTTLLVDGGYSNQYPIEVLRENGAGIVICVECCPDYSPVCTDYGDAVWGGLVMLKRRLCCRRSSHSGIDPPTQAEIQERLMYLVEALKAVPRGPRGRWGGGRQRR
ncbi:unnamed protein product [Effrenium voratum]|uniref:Patatin n=1 Tax=Effrenium voratum TaxID=2562239 RepID=A0AA36JRN1_9DINO|nr:unnamed protein product [Effrenium voratum]